MTEQYQQENINEQENSDSLELDSFDQRQVQALVPAGTTATIQKLKIPGPARLTQLSWAGVLAPSGGETVALRLYRIRPSSNPAGFGFIQLNTTFTITAANFTDAGGNIDISANIIPNLCVLDNEYLACSWVHVVGGNTLQPLNMNWNFRPVGGNEPEPAPTYTLAQYAMVFGP